MLPPEVYEFTKKSMKTTFQYPNRQTYIGPI